MEFNQPRASRSPDGRAGAARKIGGPELSRVAGKLDGGARVRQSLLVHLPDAARPPAPAFNGRPSSPALPEGIPANRCQKSEPSTVLFGSATVARLACWAQEDRLAPSGAGDTRRCSKMQEKVRYGLSVARSVILAGAERPEKSGEVNHDDSFTKGVELEIQAYQVRPRLRNLTARRFLK